MRINCVSISMENNVNKKPHLSIGRVMIVGLGFLGINLVWPIFNSFVPLFPASRQSGI